MSTLFHLLFSLAMIGFVIGMVNPTWVMRNSASPSRKKIAVVALPFLVVTASLSDWTRTPEQIAHEKEVAEQNEATEQVQEAERDAQQENSEGRQLYTYYKRVSGNEDSPGYNEQEYIRGRMVTHCNVNGTHRGYYGWIEFRTVFLEGHRLKNDPPIRMYVFAVASDDNASAIWRGEQYRQQVIDEMHQTCD
jgi:hypothetical protein